MIVSEKREHRNVMFQTLLLLLLQVIIWLALGVEGCNTNKNIFSGPSFYKCKRFCCGKAFSVQFQ